MSREKRKFGIGILCAVLMVLSHAPSPAQEGIPAGWRQYQTPELAGFNRAALDQARLFAEQLGSTAVMVVYRGAVVAAWGDVSRPLPCASMRKSMLSALYGIAVERGLIDLEATIGQLGIDDDQPLTPVEKQARVLDLISARSGIYIPAAKETASAKRNRPARGSHAPGTFWYYNNWDFNVSGVIYERLTGKTIGEALEREIAGPIGMEDFRAGDVQPQYEPSNSRWPAFDIRMSARDCARFGQLFLQNGGWGDHTIVPADWVERSTSPVSAVADGEGYGYMWWCYATRGTESFERSRPFWRQTMYSASGYGGHLILVIPAAEMVIVHRGDNDYDRIIDGREIWRLAELIWSARTGEPVERPLMTGLAPVPFAVTMPAPPRRTAITVSDSALEELAGKYAMGRISLDLRPWKGRLIATLSTGEESEFFPYAVDRYFAGPVNTTFVVIRDADGRITALEGSMFGTAFTATRAR